MQALDYGVQLITRAEWGARQPTSTSHLNATYGATRHWEGPHMGDFGHEACPGKVRGIQAFHMDDKGWTDIAYTGVVCPHGYVFEGRGLFRRTAANGTNTGNDTAYAFCYLGGEGDPFTEAGKRAMKAAMNWTRAHGGAGPNRNDHNDWKSTACPGVEIETWGDSGEPITVPTPPVTQPRSRGKVLDAITHPDGSRCDWVGVGPDHRVWHYTGTTMADMLDDPGSPVPGVEARGVTLAWAANDHDGYDLVCLLVGNEPTDVGPPGIPVWRSVAPDGGAWEPPQPHHAMLIDPAKA